LTLIQLQPWLVPEPYVVAPVAIIIVRWKKKAGKSCEVMHLSLRVFRCQDLRSVGRWNVSEKSIYI
jgi:hypothetical protein